MRIGVNPLLWINDDKPELGADVPLERCLAEARAAGYAGIELGHRFPRSVRELRPLLARHRLSLISGWYSAHLCERGVERELDALGPHLALLRAMGCETLIVGEVSGAVHREPCTLSRRPVLDAAQWPRFTRALDRLAQRVLGEGLRLAYHHHVGTVVETPEEVARLLDETSDAVGLLLDTGHLAWASRGGAPLHHWVERFAHRIAHVHLKDVRRDVLARARRDDLPFLDAVCAGVFTVPGDGALELAPVVAALRRRRYRGWLVVEAEQDPAIAHPLTYARLGFANAAHLLAACGRRAQTTSRGLGRAIGSIPRARRSAAPRPRGAAVRRPRQ